MFRKLCGDETLRNVVIVTNMWSEVTPERGAAREDELRTSDILFKPALDNGATMVRHDNTLDSARAILRNIINNQPKTLRIQRELVDEGKDVAETAAGEELNGELVAMQKKYMKEIAEIRKEAKEALAARDLAAKRELEQVRQDLLKKIEKIESDKERLTREYAAERAQADGRIKEIETALRVERKAREEKQKDVERLAKEIKDTKAHNAQQIQVMGQQLEATRRELAQAKKRGGGLLEGVVGAITGGVLGALVGGSRRP